MHIAFDADDTLWHNESVFSLTCERFAELLADHCEAGELDNKLIETEQRNLRLYGYGVKGFTLSMLETALEVSAHQIDPANIQAILDAGKAMLEHPIELLPGVKNAVIDLAAQHPLMIITKGDLFDQESKIARSGLSDLFAIIEVVSEKNPDTYRRILDRHDIAAERFVMVGNSVKSDILPVVAIGGNAVHVPYATTWVLDRVAHRGARGEGFWQIEHMSELPAVLDQIAALGWA
ncbi:MAG: HAD family hydrolase [Proteobacteria bacterium]|nr:HAD family hydrolase [Pseudomonadota bacterium]